MHKTFKDICVDVKKELDNGHYERLHKALYATPMSGMRRRILSNLIRGDVRIPVNMKYTRQIKYDKDLQILLKEGSHELISIYTYRAHKRQFIQERKAKQ